MRRWMSTAVGTSLLLLWPCPARAQKAIFVVRHAEKASEANDPSVPLSPAGAARATKLAALLKDAGVSAIYSTDFVRTRKTAEPLAQMQHMAIRLYPARDSQGKLDGETLAGLLRRENPDAVALVVGHSDNVPVILKSLGCAEEPTIAGNEYDNLFIVVPRGSGPPALVRLRY